MLVESTIAVVEDDEDIRANVYRYLKTSGFNVWGADSAEDFYVQLRRLLAHPVVADEGLPGKDGMSLIRRLSGRGVPTILTTARADLESRIAGLDAGALQYYVKPVDMQELTAGIRSQFRHKTPRSVEGDAMAPWRIDHSAARLIAPNQEAVKLTSRELELMGCLSAAQGQLVAKQALIEAVGADGADGGFHRIESQLSRLRRKTLDATGMALPVRAVFGKGLVFVT